LHNATLGLAHPDVAQENFFGDRATRPTCAPHIQVVRGGFWVVVRFS
jgi:hypothetical protein